MRLPKWLKDAVTDDTGVNFTPDKVGLVATLGAGIAGIFSMTVIQAVAVWVKGQEFHPNDFGIGLAAALAGVGALLGGGGASMWLSSRQKSTPPDGEEKP